MQEYDMEYAGIRAKDIGCYVMQRPDIPAGKKNYTVIEIPGKDGSLYIDDGTVSDIEISIELNFMTLPQQWSERYRNIKSWLLSPLGILRFTDDEGYFYKVKKVEISDVKRKNREIGTITAIFTCSGYIYREDGLKEYEIEDVLQNNYALAHPTYIISGNNNATLTVNGNKFYVNVGQNCRIDTERMITYRELNGEMMNTYVNGDYEDLYLKPGENMISVVGAEMKIIPNWRCL